MKSRIPDPRDWHYELPEFWNTSIWEKIPLSEHGLRDIEGVLDNEKFNFNDYTFGSLPLDEKLGFGQMYRKIGREDLVCAALTLFNYDEPVVLYWTIENEVEPPFLGCALKYDGAWVVIREMEELRLRFGKKTPESRGFDEIQLEIFNLVTDKTLMSVNMKRE